MIEFQNLNKIINNVQIVKDVSFKIEKGSIFCLYGKYNSGKTAIVKMLAKILTIDSGKILIDGIDIKENNKIKISFVFDNNEKNTYLSVYEYLYFYAKCMGIKKIDDAINDILKKLDLEIFKNAFFDTLDKNSKQKIIFAKSILNNPDILVIDKNMSSRFDFNDENISSVFIKMRNEEKIVLIATDDFEKIANIVTHIGIINNGKLLTFGDVDMVLNENNYHKTEIKVYEGLENAINILKTYDNIKNILYYNNTIVFVIDGDIINQNMVLENLIKNGIKVYSYKYLREDMDNVFDNIINKDKIKVIDEVNFNEI